MGLLQIVEADFQKEIHNTCILVYTRESRDNVRYAFDRIKTRVHAIPSRVCGEFLLLRLFLVCDFFLSEEDAICGK